MSIRNTSQFIFIIIKHLRPCLKKNVKLILVMSAMILAGQDAVCNLYLPPTLESSIIWYDLASIGSGYVNMSYMPNIVVDRMDAASTGLFFTIGGSGGQMMMSLDYSTPAQACRTDLLLQYDVSEGLVVEIPHTDTKIGMFRATDHQLWIPTNYVPYYFDCRE